MLRIERVKGAVPVLAVAALLMIGGAPAVLAHQCVSVEILRAPDVANPGDLIETESSASNCGDPARGFVLSWVLVSETGDRILLKKTVARIAPGGTIAGLNRLLLPRRLRPGIYDLTYFGEEPSGFTDTDTVRIVIRPRQGGGRGH